MDEWERTANRQWHETFRRLAPNGRRLDDYSAALYKAKIEAKNPGWRVEVYNEEGGFASLYLFMATSPRHAGWWIFTDRQAEECLT